MPRTKGAAKEAIKHYPQYIHEEVTAIHEESCVLEVGMGSGTMLTMMAKSHPEVQYIGVEMKEERCLRMAKKASQAGLHNIHCYCMTYTQFFTQALQSELQVDTLWITFPDPWPKKRQEQHRFVTYHSYQDFFQLIKPGGKLIFKTDHAELFAYTHTIFRHGPWPIRYTTTNLHESTYEGNVTTDFEARYLKEGRPIYLLEVENVLLH